MRSNLLTKPLLTAALGSVVVMAAAGAQSAQAAPRPSSATAASAPSARTSAVHRTARPVVVRTARAATFVASADEAEARFLELADLIGQSCEPDVLAAVGRVAPALAPTPADPVALHPAEECAAQRHQLRISKAFSGTVTATYEQMRDRLTTLRYPRARIHRMPNFAGRPVSRLDLRVGADHLALEVTDIGGGVMVRAFGAPQGVSVTDVRLKPEVDLPTS